MRDGDKERHLVHKHNIHAEGDRVMQGENVSQNRSNQRGHMGLSLLDSFPFERVEIWPKDVFGCQSVGPGDRAVQQELVVNNLVKIVGTTEVKSHTGGYYFIVQ